jgi:hypothetical protein
MRWGKKEEKLCESSLPCSASNFSSAVVVLARQKSGGRKNDEDDVCEVDLTRAGNSKQQAHTSAHNNSNGGVALGYGLMLPTATGAPVNSIFEFNWSIQMVQPPGFCKRTRKQRLEPLVHTRLVPRKPCSLTVATTSAHRKDSGDSMQQTN